MRRRCSRPPVAVLLPLGLWLGLVTKANAGNLQAKADQEATINGDAANQNFTNGTQAFMLVGKNSSLHPIRGLVRFSFADFATPLRAGRITVSSAYVYMKTLVHPTATVANQQPSPIPLQLHRITAGNWFEGPSPAAGSSQSIGVACAGGGGATWLYPNCANTGAGWAFAGTESTSRTGPGSVTSFFFPTTASVVADVQGWIDGTLSNFGYNVRSAGVGSAEAGGVRALTRIDWHGSDTLYIDVNYTCKTGFEASGNDCTSCTSSIRTNSCHEGGGNSCSDALLTSPAYSCICNNPAYENGPLVGGRVGSCVDRNGCAGNPCDDAGNASATCTDAVAPAAGYTCNCTTGFTSNGTTCVGLCTRTAGDPVPMPPSMSDPCQNGGYCTVGSPGTWTCTCPVGWVSSGGSNPACVNFDACNGTALSRCNTAQAGNTCNDDLPPLTTYSCTCGNAAYESGTIGAQPACVNRDECATNHCDDGGDAGAACIDAIAPAMGYSCGCSSALWKVGTVGAFASCVDRDECAEGNPCGNGTCTNIPNGGGWSCECDVGYVLDGPEQTPTCVNPNGCSPTAAIACVTQQLGNACVDDPPPRLGYTCDCSHPGYTASIDGRSCVDKNDCTTDHCAEGGDSRGSCVDRRAPRAGYDCDCSVGFEFDGKTCVDVDECSSGANPCGKGSCSNTKGGYVCTCKSGFAATAGEHPTCKETSSTYLSVTTEAGFCAAAGADQAPLRSVLWLVGWLVLARAAQGRRRARRG